MAGLRWTTGFSQQPYIVGCLLQLSVVQILAWGFRIWARTYIHSVGHGQPLRELPIAKKNWTWVTTWNHISRGPSKPKDAFSWLPFKKWMSFHCQLALRWAASLQVLGHGYQGHKSKINNHYVCITYSIIYDKSEHGVPDTTCHVNECFVVSFCNNNSFTSQFQNMLPIILNTTVRGLEPWWSFPKMMMGMASFAQWPHILLLHQLRLLPGKLPPALLRGNRKSGLPVAQVRPPTNRHMGHRWH